MSAAGQQKILAVFAHPDDETVVTPVLAKYARLGWDITVIIATDGRYGFTSHYGMKSSDSLIMVREEEIKCSCKAIGANVPIMLHAHDGMRGLEGVDAQFREFSEITEGVEKVIEELEPDVIITMGPEGDSGHPDHRIVSAIVTQIVQKRGDDTALYYHGWSKSQVEKYEGWNLHYVSDEYLGTTISYSAEDEERHFTAIRCYESQYDKETMEEWIANDKSDEENVLYFRRFDKKSEESTSF